MRLRFEFEREFERERERERSSHQRCSVRKGVFTELLQETASGNILLLVSSPDNGTGSLET